MVHFKGIKIVSILRNTILYTKKSGKISFALSLSILALGVRPLNSNQILSEKHVSAPPSLFLHNNQKWSFKSLFVIHRLQQLAFLLCHQSKQCSPDRSFCQKPQIWLLEISEVLVSQIIN